MVLLAFRVALAAVLGVVTPVVLPILALLAGGALLIAIGFAWAGHWHDALKAVWACFLCGATFSVIAVLARLVNPFAFSLPVAVSNQRNQ